MSKIIKAQNEKFLKLLCIIKKIAETTVQRRKNSKRGRPRKFSLFQIIACLVYKVKRGIASFRELEYRINQDTEFKKSIGIEKKSRLFIHSKISSKNRRGFIASYLRRVNSRN